MCRGGVTPPLQTYLDISFAIPLNWTASDRISRRTQHALRESRNQLDLGIFLSKLGQEFDC